MDRDREGERPRGIQVQGEYIRLLRHQRGWTQQELATRAGYCDRLVRKAEQGRFLMPETIQVLAETLSTEHNIIRPEDLWETPRCAVALFVEWLREPLAHSSRSLSRMVADDVELTCKGTAGVPFSGTFLGRSALKGWLRKFGRAVAMVDDELPDETLLVDQHQAYYATWRVLRQGERSSEPAEVSFRLHFSRGLIDSIDVAGDTWAWVAFFDGGIARSQSRARRNRKLHAPADRRRASPRVVLAAAVGSMSHEIES